MLLLEKSFALVSANSRQGGMFFMLGCVLSAFSKNKRRGEQGTELWCLIEKNPLQAPSIEIREERNKLTVAG